MPQNPQQLLAPDGRKLFCWHWHPTGAVRARVLLLHGIESHPGWFEGTGKWLAKLGFHVVAPQRRGSGTDEILRGDIDAYRTWLDDVSLVAENLKRERPPVPIHILGISWGGKLACAVAALSEPSLASLILISPGLVPKVTVSFFTKLNIALCSFLRPSRFFALPIGGPPMFTANARQQEFIAGDAPRLKKVTARFFAENAKLDWFLKNGLAAIRVPVLMLLAEHDEIIDKAKTRNMFARFGSSTKKILEYPGTTHTLEFEDNPDFWRKDVLAWLDSFKPL